MDKDILNYLNELEGIDLSDSNHRLTLRIPKSVLNEVDKRRQNRWINISRNTFILMHLFKGMGINHED